MEVKGKDFITFNAVDYMDEKITVIGEIEKLGEEAWVKMPLEECIEYFDQHGGGTIRGIQIKTSTKLQKVKSGSCVIG